jgi:hypothetical protein
VVEAWATGYVVGSASDEAGKVEVVSGRAPAEWSSMDVPLASR